MRPLLLITALLISTLLIAYLPVDAHYIEPSIQEFTLERGDQVEGSFTFINEEDKNITIESKIYSYNPKDESFSDEQPFVRVTNSENSLEPKGEIEITFVINVPDNIELGTHFNVISNEETLETPEDKGIGLKAGVGELIVIHVVEDKEGNPLEDSFTKDSSLNVTVSDKGFPFVKPTILQVEYSNNTKYVLHPTGEIRLLELYPVKIRTTVRFNPEAKAVYPGESLKEEYEINAWSIGNSLKSMSSIARIQLTDGKNPIEARADFSIKNEFYSLVIITTLIICSAGVLYARSRRHQSK